MEWRFFCSLDPRPPAVVVVGGHVKRGVWGAAVCSLVMSDIWAMGWCTYYTAGKSIYTFPRTGSLRFVHVHHELNLCHLVRRSFASEHDVRGFKPQQYRFSLCGIWLDGSSWLYRERAAKVLIHTNDVSALVCLETQHGLNWECAVL